MGGNALIYDNLDVDQKNIIDILEDSELDFTCVHNLSDRIHFVLKIKNNVNTPFFMDNYKLHKEMHEINLLYHSWLYSENHKKIVDRFNKDPLMMRIFKLTGFYLEYYKIELRVERFLNHSIRLIFRKNFNLSEVV